MSRRRKGLPVHGVVLLDKPEGPSSNQALQRVRRLFQARKGGHTGTLDPFATGLLPLCFGEASKTTSRLLDARKGYEARALLGRATSTGDRTGEDVMDMPVPALTLASLDDAFEAFRGPITQLPPMFSALKHEGRPLYEWAREGITVPRKHRDVTIHELTVLTWEPPLLSFRVECSKGTYVRTLAEDIARALGTVAHLQALRRTRVGPFDGKHMVTMEMLEQAAEGGQLADYLLPVDAGLAGWPLAHLDDAGARAFRNGNPAAPRETHPEHMEVLVRDFAEAPLGIGQIEGGAVQPRKVFVFDD